MNDVVRTALLGFGTAGRVFHAPFLAADPRFSLDVVVTGDPGRRDEVVRLHPDARVVASTEALFAEPDLADRIDLVVIGTPPATHAPLARAAIDRGIAVLVDKPFCVSSAEGEELIAAAAAAGVPLTVFQNRRWDADFLTLRGLLEAGELGDVRRFESRFEWWKPDEPKAWKAGAAPAQGGGMLFDLGTHLIDQAICLFGPVAESHAELASHRTPGTDDDAFVSLRHESGVRTQLWMNGMAAQVGPRFHVLGSRSAYTKWGLDSQERALGDGMSPADAAYGVEPESAWGSLGIYGDLRSVPAERGRYGDFYELLAAALLDGGPLPVDPADSLAVIALIEDLHSRFGVSGEQ